MVMANTVVMASMAVARSMGMDTGRGSISSYQSRSSSLPSPYLVLVIGQGRGREKVGRKNDASVVLEGEKTVALDGGEGQVKKIEVKASLPHGVKTRMPQGCGASYGCDGW